MPWAKLDDQFPDHPKVVQAGPAAAWLHVCAICYASRYLTDGFVPVGQVRKLADVPDSDALAAKLVQVGLWEAADGGFRVHDYLKYNPSRAQVMAERERNAARQEQWRTRNAVSNAVSATAPSPFPLPFPDPDPNSEGTAVAARRKRRDRAPAPPAVEVYRETMHRYPDKALYDTIADAVGEDDDQLALWRRITEAWRDHGWNRSNLAGMLECVRRREVPGSRPNGRGSPRAGPNAPVVIERCVADIPRGWLQESFDPDEEPQL
jgi:hypothetical protein